MLAVDEHGELVDGDQIMAMTALDLHERGDAAQRRDRRDRDVEPRAAARAARGAGIDVVETPVGDRHVVAAMAERDLAIGGEQSGHIVFADLATTGDGCSPGCSSPISCARTRRPLSALAAQMTRLPAGAGERAGRAAASTSTTRPRCGTRCATVEAELGDRGRVLVRASGTEPLVRVMVEAPTAGRGRRGRRAGRGAVERRTIRPRVAGGSDSPEAASGPALATLPAFDVRNRRRGAAPPAARRPSWRRS